MSECPCVLALDLGTSAFKAGVVCGGRLAAPVSSVPVAISEPPRGHITCEPALYVECARAALAEAAGAARAAGLRVQAIGVCSQAQTYVEMNTHGAATGRAVVWTDATARREATETARALPDLAATSGVLGANPQMLLPKLVRASRQARRAARYLLLNEFVIHDLTGEAVGDQTLQGMGGFFDIRTRHWRPDALALAGLGAEHFAEIAPAAGRSAQVTEETADALGVPRVPVFSCGNDQCCSAVGSGVTTEGEIAATFGTAMVVFAPTREMRLPQSEQQIAGIDPLTGGYFLLAFEAGLAGALQALADASIRGGSVEALIAAAMHDREHPCEHAGETPCGAPLAPAAEARRCMERGAESFRGLLAQVCPTLPRRIVASGGMARSAAWLELVQTVVGVPIARAPHEHASLLGIARILREHAPEIATH